MEIYSLRVNHLQNPLGYEMDRTVFSWKVRGAKGKKQSAARIRVSVSEDLESEICAVDTGFLPELSSTGARIDVGLAPRTRYYWDVTVRTDCGEEEKSEVQWFETGKIEEPWQAQWITCNNDEARHPIFRKKVSRSGKVKKARLYICGLGLYEVYYNGKRIGDEYLAPYCNDYNEWVQYQTYDVTEMLDEDGDLSVHLGNGWYKGRFGFDTDPDARYYGRGWKLIAERRVTYEDDREEIIGTDKSWTVERSNLIFSNIYDGEHRDDTLPTLPTENAICCDAPAGKLMARLSTPVTVHETFEPKELIHTPAGETVLDLGQEFTGIFRLQVNEPAGTKIRIQTGEVLQNGNFYRENLRTAKSEYIYVSDGKEKILSPHFTFYGYRYVKIEGIQNLKKEDFTGLALYSNIPETGTVTTGNDLVNRLLSNIRWGMKSNFLDLPTDCPQRDERMGWTGDAQIFSPTALYMADTYAFYRKFLYDMACEQKKKNGEVPQVIPHFGKNGTSSVWGDAACIIPWNIYRFYGDKSILEDQFESMRSWVDYIREKDGEEHKWRYEFHYGDWLALDNPLAGDDGVLGGTDERFIADVFYAASAGIVSRAAHVLGRIEEEEEYADLEKQQREWIKREYYTQTGKCCIRTQTAQLLTLKYKLSDRPEEALSTLKTLLDESDGKLKTGFVGTPLLCMMLSEYGEDALAYDLLLNEEYPGWLNEVKLGATTIWERWNSIDENGLISGTGMNSLNHYSSGAVAEWLFRYVGGIGLCEGKHGCAGLKKVIMSPRLDRRLGSAEASYDSASGIYRCGWKFTDDDQVRIKVSVPFGGEAELILPGAGEELFNNSENAAFCCVKDGRCILDAGEYEIQYHVRNEQFVLSVDSSIRRLLKNEAARKFIGSMLPLEMIPKEFMTMTFRRLAVRFGGAQEEQLAQINEVLKTF